MASCPFTCRNIVEHRHHNRRRAPPPLHCCIAAVAKPTLFCFSSYSYPFQLNRRDSFSTTLGSWSGCCRATTGPKPEPPPPGKHLSSISGVTATFARFQDSVRIFFAVLFWMSLFFWSSIWDGGNGGRPNKQSRFRK